MFIKKKLLLLDSKICVVVSIVILSSAFSVFSIPQTGGWVGKYPWVKCWQLPNTDNGLRPHACWHSVGNAPDGDIYVGGMDHSTNSALYRIYMKDDTLRYLGDAKSASQSVNNWQSGETCQKFHTRPTYFNGRVYVATLDRSDINDAYLSTRGFHYYAYDLVQKKFMDLSVNSPGGVGAEHLQIVTLAADPKLNRVYGAAIPTVDIVYYDISQDRSYTIGRPSSFTRYIYTNRFMFVDSRSRLYFTAGSEYWSPGSDPNIYNHVHYYDPQTKTFGDLNDWQLKYNAFEMGMWTRDRKICYVIDNKCNLFKFTDEGPTFTYLGRPVENDPNWIYQVSPNGKKIYNANKTISEYEISTGKVTTLCSVSDLDGQAGAQTWCIGYDSWDNNGNFYFACFSNYGINVIVVRFNPVKYKVDKGILPALVEVEAEAGSEPNQVIVKRKGGSNDKELEVVYNIDAAIDNDALTKQVRGSVIIPAGQSFATVTVTQQDIKIVGTKFNFTVIGDGDQYVPGNNKSIYIELTSNINNFNLLNSLKVNNPISIFKTANGKIIIKVNLVKQEIISLKIIDCNGKIIAQKVLYTNGIQEIKFDDLYKNFKGICFVQMQYMNKNYIEKIIAY